MRAQVSFLPSSPVREVLDGIDWAELSVGELDVAQLESDRESARVLILSTEEADEAWAEIEHYAIQMPMFPLLVGPSDRLDAKASPFLKLAPLTSFSADQSVADSARKLLTRSGWLYEQLAVIDPSAAPLVQNALCEWARCSVGVLGLVNVSMDSSTTDLAEQLDLLRDTAYATIDRVSTKSLSTDDLWTLLLAVRLPWTRESLTRQISESRILRDFISNTRGSRKVILCADETIHGLVGPFSASSSQWAPASDNPLRDTMLELAESQEEREALEMLFKKRFSTEELNRFIDALGRKR